MAAEGRGGGDRERKGARLYLIDGPSLVYRAFYALPESIATSTGMPTNAIFGFASMLVKLISERGAAPAIVVWDAGTSGRTELYPEYKAQRIARPDLLKMQWPACEELVTAFGYRNISVDGYEADDVIGSLAEQARAAGVPVTILTGDRDVFQLIDEDGLIEVMATARGMTETKTYDWQAVIDRYGITPRLIPDFYGLKGDASDNIPGVPGIGEKTARELLERFGSIDGVLANVAQVGGSRRRQNLLQHAELARISRELARIRRDVPVQFDPEAELSAEPDRSKLREVFRRYELRDPLRRLEEALGEQAAPRQRGERRLESELILGDPTQIQTLGDGEAAVLVERSEPAEGELFAEGDPFRFAVATAQKVLVGGCGGAEEVIRRLEGWPVIAHDAKALSVLPAKLAHDTMIGAYLLDPARRGYPLEELCEQNGLVSEVGDPLGARAACMLALAAGQREQIEKLGLQPLLSEIELPLVSVLKEMERAGVRLNLERLAQIASDVRMEISSLEQEIFDLAGQQFVIGSPQQLGEVLFVKLGLSRKRRGKTGFSTDARVLQAIRSEHPIVQRVERWRELSTLLKTYLDVLPQMVDGQSRLHTTFLQTVAQTGRLSSTNPNLQNVPVRTPLGRRIRGCFEAEQGALLISADYSQIELRVLANLADEPVLKEVFARGEDVHSATASRVFGVSTDEIDEGMRSKAKMINYGIVYGLSDFGLADRLNIPRAEAKEFIDAYLERFEKVAQFIDETIKRAGEQGYVTTVWGRRRQIPELLARNLQVRSQGERLAVNTVIQGTAADIMKLAMLRCDSALRAAGSQAKLILTIHDELLFEIPSEPEPSVKAACELIRREMCAVWDDREPALVVDIGVGADWLAAKQHELLSA